MPAHEIYHSRSDSASFTFTGDELKVKESAASAGYGIRVLENGRLGFAYCQRDDEVEKAVGRAKRLSRFSVRSGFSFAPRSDCAKPDIFDPQLAAMDYAELRGYVGTVREAAQSKGGRARVMLSSGNSHVGLENSSGFSGAYDKTWFSAYTECMDGDGFGFAYLTSNRAPTQSSLRDAGMKAAEMAKAMRGAKKPESGDCTVVLELEALDSIMDVFLQSFSADWKRRKTTRLRQGARMFSEKFTLCDDGLAEGAEARPFDDEGTPSARRPLVDRGTVASFLSDRETAALAGERQAGACGRESYERQPSIGQSNITIPGGDRKDLSGIGRHLEIHSMHGSHTANATTGDFGLEVSVAFLVDKGRRTPVRGFMLSGNVFRMFADIAAVEKGVRTLGGLSAPRIAFDGLTTVS
ncbi:MAG: TldD/PmbA family protein [Candidatus ainarchaeum sp.]|nr:TldD/PmbA family protein [Candidatus ainarchaeum sp.]